ncbi:PAS domain S-box protein [Amylibacter sp. SFDW26]|uniref:CHASE domain-containing protein n=1 Tax=Amylibacter sp. SFDW26 TaxID=2652722 RepID=UPI00126161E3|nr:CHASE domain-containing protein [Amylibacter sp. SFDW26]KAB7613773.1 PAS domain S-box protein [Amylibacter sp. SFDW26]
MKFFKSIKDRLKNYVSEFRLSFIIRIGIILVCLLITGFATFGVMGVGEKRSAKTFETMTLDSKQAIRHRLDTYKRSLYGGAGLLKASDFVSIDDWKAYVDELNLEKELGGVNGIGWIVPFHNDVTNEFLDYVKITGVKDFKIHPEVKSEEHFVILFIEPYENNAEAIGLDIAFEKNRRDAAVSSRKTGEVTLTKRIFLVQDHNHTPGFLMLRPVYNGSNTNITAENRDAEFSGWVYAAFIADKALDMLTEPQGVDFELAIYDGEEISDDALIYKTNDFRDKSAFYKTEKISLHGQTWMLHWQTTRLYEDIHFSYLPFVTLFSGVFLTLLISLQLRALSNRATQVEKEVILKTKELKQSSEELQKTEKRWDLALTGAEIGVFDINLTNGTAVMSKTWMKLMRFSDKAENFMSPDDFLDRIHPDDKEDKIAGDKACISGEVKRSLTEYRILDGLDEWRWMRSDSVIAEHDENGTPTRMIGTQTDITQLKTAREKLKSSRQQLSYIIAQAPVAMALVDNDGFFFNVNEALAKFTGLRQSELIGSDFQSLVEPSELPEILRAVSDLGKGKETSYQKEHRFLHKNAGIIWGLLHISWMASNDDTSAYFIAQIIDITEKKEAELVKGEFVASVSHELRTPLTSIKGSVGLILGGMRDSVPENILRLLEIAHSNCDRLTNLVNDILDLEKMASNKLTFNYSSEDVCTLIENSVARIKPMAHEADVEVEVILPKRKSKAWIDSDRFEQVIANLLSNAVKFSKTGGKVTVLTEALEKEVKISVIDRGSGIPDNFKDKIFSPFAQADSSATRNNGGTGLGLNISKHLIERLGGGIGYSSTPDVETIFWITIPVRRKKVITQDPLAISNNYKMNILHIEDDEDFSILIAETFSDIANVTRASSIKEAKRVLQLEPYSMIIIDWGLPDGDGETLLTDISEHCHGVPIIGLSAAEPSLKNDNSIVELVKTRLTLQEIRDRCLIEIDKKT